MASSDLQEGGLWRIRECNADAVSVAVEGTIAARGVVSREYSSYCGNYTYDGKKLVTRVDAASDPNRIGSDQVHGVRFDGARAKLLH
jgi:Lipocalin-like domain